MITKTLKIRLKKCLLTLFKKMNVLIGDIGNTSTKICLVDIKNFKPKKILFIYSKKILDKHYLKKVFKQILKNKKLCRSSLFSCVVPKYENIVKKFLKTNYKINLLEIKNKKIKKLININIKNKKQVGSDRIANAVGVYYKYKNNCIVLDFGTATTFDVVTNNGVYNGGVIAPGINLSIKSLSKGIFLKVFWSSTLLLKVIIPLAEK